MKVKELIERLNKCPQDHEVVFWDYYCDEEFIQIPAIKEIEIENENKIAKIAISQISYDEYLEFCHE